MKDRLYNLSRSVSIYALYCLLFFIPISISLVEISAGLVFLSFVICKIIRPDFKFIKFRPILPLFLFLFFSALSICNSGQYVNKSLQALFGKWMQYIGIFLVLQDSIYDEKVVRRAIYVLLCSALLVVLSGFSQYFFGVEFLRHKSMTLLYGQMLAMTSSFTHYNALGCYLIIILSISVSLLLSRDSHYGIKPIYLLGFSLLSTIAIILTLSRGSWLALAFSFIFISVLSKQNIKRFIPIFIVIIAIFLFPAFHERLFLSFKASGDSDRFKYWLAALKMIGEYPFLGIGVGTFMANFPKYLPDVNISYAHNCYLQIWAETGIFSLASFILFAVSVIYLGIRRFIVSRDFLLLGLLSGMAGFLVHSFFEVNLYSLQLAFLFWVLMGLIGAKVHAPGFEK